MTRKSAATAADTPQSAAFIARYGDPVSLRAIADDAFHLVIDCEKLNPRYSNLMIVDVGRWKSPNATEFVAAFQDRSVANAALTARAQDTADYFARAATEAAAALTRIRGIERRVQLARDAALAALAGADAVTHAGLAARAARFDRAFPPPDDPAWLDLEGLA